MNRAQNSLSAYLVHFVSGSIISINLNAISHDMQGESQPLQTLIWSNKAFENRIKDCVLNSLEKVNN